MSEFANETAGGDGKPRVAVAMPDGRRFETTPQEMAELSGRTFPVNDRVPGAPGEGFGLAEWYEAAVRGPDGGEDASRPTHLVVRAADEFQATIPWAELGGALFQYAIGGLPLEKGSPIRLYVPDGSSACLNVKSVVNVRFVRDSTLGDEAAYGFVNEVSPNRLIKGLKAK
ncbi:hypothetical protein ACFPPD_06595 [Cohnella suwonensis]|uniref:Oxidoreductase molybdopterin-binding domain-containing protein n=1 Tax=Cohnella suwonensis TaxID=696072 RepID=A0ABW0LU94_9BACL